MRPSLWPNPWKMKWPRLQRIAAPKIQKRACERSWRSERPYLIKFKTPAGQALVIGLELLSARFERQPHQVEESAYDEVEAINSMSRLAISSPWLS